MLKFLLRLSFIVSLRFFVYTHLILPVLASDGSSKFVHVRKLVFKYSESEIRIALSFSFVVVHTSSLLYPMQFDQREYFFRDGIQVNLHVRSSK